MVLMVVVRWMKLFKEADEEVHLKGSSGDTIRRVSFDPTGQTLLALVGGDCVPGSARRRTTASETYAQPRTFRARR
uniref:Uncharacterized protein n=1 Tax=Vespula pensylvanica TaxID=30213 RepID=A0A834P822_VESPE|nr:hypothetical protein H0235_004712 [Vespula pensylvanica]